MKVLFVAPWIPSKIRPRSFALLQMLSKQHDVRFLGLASSPQEGRQAAELPVQEVALVKRDRAASMARCLLALPTKVALQQAYANVAGLTTALREQLRGWRPDVVHLNVFRTAHLVEQCGDTPVIIDLDEFRSEYYEQLAVSASLPWRVVGRIEAPRMRAREDALVRKGVPLILSAPQPVGQEKPETYLVRSPYDYPLATDFGPRRPVILFVGRLTYEANVDGLMWFAENCWEGIRQRHPDAVLRIVGTEPPAAVRALTAGGNVEIHANVPDVDMYYEEAAVAIVPVRRGTGVQMKLIQALAAGVPTVATTAVVSRAGVRHDVDVIQADTPQAWVDGVSRLLTDSATALRLSNNGRLWARANHSWEAVEEQLAAAYKSVTR